MAELMLDQSTIDLMRTHLPRVADSAVSAIIAEVPSYEGALTGPMGENIRNAVQVALGGFISLAARPRHGVPRGPNAPAMEGAYQLGRGEARSGRSMEALLAAYRVGARVSWREMSRDLVGAGVQAEVLAQFAELVFAYIDQLSASSVAGHADEQERTGRVRQQLWEALARDLLAGEAPEALARSAEGAEWAPPATLTAVLLPEAHVRQVIPSVDPRTLVVAEPDWSSTSPSRSGTLGLPERRSVLLVPDVRRSVLLRRLAGARAVVGPTREWVRVRSSYLRAHRALALVEAGAGARGGQPLDTDRVLVPLVLGADLEALADLRAQVLAPLAGLSDSSRDKLIETLRAWLCHQGRRQAVAEELFVHPQTVRYRMGQLREAYGDRLEDPAFVREAVVALAWSPPAVGTAGP